MMFNFLGLYLFVKKCVNSWDYTYSFKNVLISEINCQNVLISVDQKYFNPTTSIPPTRRRRPPRRNPTFEK